VRQERKAEPVRRVTRMVGKAPVRTWTRWAGKAGELAMWGIRRLLGCVGRVVDAAPQRTAG
jgi:hypothetical protein